MKNKIYPKFTLVGAGPGDPSLITLKAVDALKNADVVLYDALIDTRLLEHAPQALKVYVGKRKGNHRFSQEKINEMIVAYALSHGHVIRLKGGDPFIFGRGAEEIAYAESFAIPTEVVPGISSSFGVPTSHGISLTQRKVSESVWVITGTTSARKLSSDVALAAQSTATVVILMGMSKLKQIVEIFTKAGKADTPIGIIQNGTTSHEKSVFGLVDDIVEKVEESGISSPAIIVIGDVVKHSHKLAHIYQNLNSEFIYV